MALYRSGSTSTSFSYAQELELSYTLLDLSCSQTALFNEWYSAAKYGYKCVEALHRKLIITSALIDTLATVNPNSVECITPKQVCDIAGKVKRIINNSTPC